MSDQFKGVSPYERQEHSDENHAKKVNNYVWDGNAWVRQDNTSGGGGLATVTILSMPTTSVTGQVSVTGLPTVSIGNTVPVTGTFYQATQPVSGTVAVTGLPTVSISALPSVNGNMSVTSMPTTSITGTVGVTGLPTVSIGNPITVTSAPTTSVTGTVGVTGLPTVSVAALPSLTGQLSKFRASTSVTTCISGATTSLTLKASNTGRIRATIYNNSTQNLYVKEGATASATSYTYLLGSGDLVIIDDYVGQVDGVWNGVNGSAQVSEVT